VDEQRRRTQHLEIPIHFFKFYLSCPILWYHEYLRFKLPSQVNTISELVKSAK
jgi:hypothetical protein